MAQPSARVVVALLTPEEGGELVAGVVLAWPQTEIGQEGLGLLRRETQGGAGGEAHVQTTQQHHPQARHRSSVCGGSL
jgi:hypothetical protein